MNEISFETKNVMKENLTFFTMWFPVQSYYYLHSVLNSHASIPFKYFFLLTRHNRKA